MQAKHATNATCVTRAGVSVREKRVESEWSQRTGEFAASAGPSVGPSFCLFGSLFCRMESADNDFLPKEDSCPASEDAGSVTPAVHSARRTCFISNAIRKRVRSEYYRIRQNKRQERSVLVKVSITGFVISSALISTSFTDRRHHQQAENEETRVGKEETGVCITSRLRAIIRRTTTFTLFAKSQLFLI